MKKLFLLAWPIALAAVSCSNEEVVSVNNDTNEIKFTAVAENATRANTDETFCNYVLPDAFDVWACTTADGKSYFAQVNYALKTSGKWETNGENLRFWPNTNGDALDFYAMRNYQDTPAWDADNATTKLSTVFEAKTDVAAQKDLIYAVATNQTKPGTTGEPNKGDVNLNFRHALSQIVFKAKNTNQNLAVKITKVEILNVANIGTCKLPKTSTATPFVDHDGDKNAVPTPTCTWTVSNATTADYGVLTEDCFLEGDSDGTLNLTNGKDTNTKIADSNGKQPGEEGYVTTLDRDFSKAMLLIPQTTVPASISTANKPSALRNGEGAMIAVTCQMWNLNTANTYVDGDDVLLFNGIAYIPLTATWDPGKKYIYTLVFGKANGGYDEDGEDILVPISFTVSVDDFTTVVPGDVYVDTVDRTNP
ncbi:MAG: fimbrillin family protein [Candidatus Limisoma sp.]